MAPTRVLIVAFYSFAGLTRGDWNQFLPAQAKTYVHKYGKGYEQLTANEQSKETEVVQEAQRLKDDRTEEKNRLVQERNQEHARLQEESERLAQELENERAKLKAELAEEKQRMGKEEKREHKRLSEEHQRARQRLSDEANRTRVRLADERRREEDREKPQVESVKRIAESKDAESKQVGSKKKVANDEDAAEKVVLDKLAKSTIEAPSMLVAAPEGKASEPDESDEQEHHLPKYFAEERKYLITRYKTERRRYQKENGTDAAKRIAKELRRKEVGLKELQQRELEWVSRHGKLGEVASGIVDADLESVLKTTASTQTMIAASADAKLEKRIQDQHKWFDSERNLLRERFERERSRYIKDGDSDAVERIREETNRMAKGLEELAQREKEWTKNVRRKVQKSSEEKSSDQKGTDKEWTKNVRRKVQKSSEEKSTDQKGTEKEWTKNVHRKVETKSEHELLETDLLPTNLADVNVSIGMFTAAFMTLAIVSGIVGYVHQRARQPSEDSRSIRAGLLPDQEASYTSVSEYVPPTLLLAS